MVAGPPPGFRKAIPLTVKLKVVLRQNGKCTFCKEHLGDLEGLEFDHVPALQLRIWCEEAQDTIPAANSVDHIEAKHIDCHAIKTYGSKATGRGSDISEIARTKRLTKKQEAFRQRLLAKQDGQPQEERKKPKHKWPKRRFNSGARNDKARQRNKTTDSDCDE